ncbi:MAG: MOSC domain-containing protein [Candidatus Eisenbacteria bacterium]|nr:MOSC domain-containing protein [Candidatus Latescibacterota bacterium]MBD3302775.1 MOSC domain-containing protein [Candidatus Eisenbacteria bacterium]
MSEQARVRIISVNVGRAVPVEWRGRTGSTGIRKTPVDRPVTFGPDGLDGDEQGDPTVHGTIDKAVYMYDASHYVHWRREIDGVEVPYGFFGENLTVAGLLEEEVRVGDRFRVGEAVLTATGPRFPCWKLESRVGRTGFIRTFLRSGRSGVYFSVSGTGRFGADDEMVRIETDPGRPTIAEVVRKKWEDDGKG